MHDSRYISGVYSSGISLYSFDPASLEILRKLGEVISSQDDLLQLVRSVVPSQSQTLPQCTASEHLSPPTGGHVQVHDAGDSLSWNNRRDFQQQYTTPDWYAQQPDSASTTPAASTGVAAVRWFGLLANYASHPEALDEEAEDAPVGGQEGGFLDLFNGQDENDMTPLQRATKIVDDSQPLEKRNPLEKAIGEEGMWQASGNILLLDREQILFGNFLHRICSWV